MDVICEKCDSKYDIPDSKLPVGKSVGFTCPKCRHKMPVMRMDDTEIEDEVEFSLDEEQDSGSPSPSFAFDEADSDKPSIDFEEDDSIYNSNDKPFDFVEEEYETALICENNPVFREKIRIALDLMEYSVTIAENTRDALKSMRYHTYDLVVLNEGFDTANPDVNGILIYLNRLVMAERRTITLFVLTERYNTFDSMMAYNRSANALVNIRDIDKIDTILQKGINDTEVLYKIYKEALINAGRM